MIMHNDDKTFAIIFAIWGVGILVSLSFWGFIIWAIIKLMAHFDVI